MLVLTRRLMERLYIGDDICVTVVRLEGGQVRLGIEAPRNVPVIREELLRRWGKSLTPTAVGVGVEEADTPGEIRIPPSLVRGTDSPLPAPSR